jgi:L-cysteine:1D-myo-inositol 2-amino-2-deoxy-alpha-D-glucopyranoside ligase
LGAPYWVQGGGEDLLFPHHEMSTSHLRGLTGLDSPVAVQAHAGLIGLSGEKMSKSLGNLVFVSELRRAGVDPSAIRLALLSGHYRRDREWTAELLARAEARLGRWRRGIIRGGGGGSPTELEALARLRRALALDLDSPGAIAAVDAWVESNGPAEAPVLAAAVDALLGVAL